jgi:putative solute:sodium symporter small subunit
MHTTPANLSVDERKRLRYWQHVRRLTLCCLLAWFGVTFCVIFFARDLAGLTFFNWPLSFYMAAQGLTLFYVLIIGVYALVMRFLDRDFKRAGSHGE